MFKLKVLGKQTKEALKGQGVITASKILANMITIQAQYINGKIKINSF